MEIAQQTNLHFKGVDFLHLVFNSLKVYEMGANIDLNIAPKVFFPKEEEKAFNILMEINLTCKDFFTLQVMAIGIFEFSNKVEEEDQKRAFINTNAPAIMFPYVRAFISTLTAAMGRSTAPIILPPQFFAGELEELKIPGHDIEEVTPA